MTTGARGVRFVELSEDHLEDVMAVELEAYPEAWTIGMFREEIRSPRSHFYVVFLGDVLVGYGGFWLVLDEAHITSLTVRDRFRSRGLGRGIVIFLLNHAKQVGARLVTLEVRASNVLARDLYLSMGFEPVGIRKDYYPKSREDAIVMLKEMD